MGLAEKVIQCILSKLYCREVIQEWLSCICSMYLFNIMQRSNSRMVILWVYPMGLSHGSCREVIRECLSYGFILWVLQRSNSRMVIRFISWVLQRSNSRMVILWVYPMGLSYGFILWVYPMGLAEK